MVKFDNEDGLALILLLEEMRLRHKLTGKEIKHLFVQACCSEQIRAEIADTVARILQNGESGDA